jgi:hypothetical protein
VDQTVKTQAAAAVSSRGTLEERADVPEGQCGSYGEEKTISYPYLKSKSNFWRKELERGEWNCRECNLRNRIV